MVTAGEALAAKVIADAKKLAARFSIPQSDAVQIVILAEIRDALKEQQATALPKVTMSRGRLQINPSAFNQLGYANHSFLSLSFTASGAAFIDMPALVQLTLLEPTAAAYIEFEKAPNTRQNGTPVIQAYQQFVAPLQAKRIWIQGASTVGILYIWCFW